MSVLVDVPGVVVDTTGPTVDGRVHLRLLTVDPDVRGTGAGQAAITALCAQADAAGWTVELAATVDFGSDLRRLVGWYGRHGFTIDRSRPALVPHHLPMVRRPQLAAA